MKDGKLLTNQFVLHEFHLKQWLTVKIGKYEISYSLYEVKHRFLFQCIMTIKIYPSLSLH